VSGMTVTLILGLILNAIILPLAFKRVIWLARLITSGQPAPDRIQGVTGRVGLALKTQLQEVILQKRLLKWSLPGAAHAFVMYAFLILASVYLEAYGVLLSRNPHWKIPIIGSWPILGFLQDFIGVMCLAGLATFSLIRLKNAPAKLGRKSRFDGSHLGGAWVTLFMIFNVIWTMFLFRGASSAAGNLPYKHGAFASIGLGKIFDGLSEDPLLLLEHVGLLLHIGVMLVFLIMVLHSKHLHIFIAPINVMFKRSPMALGAAKPLMSGGKPFTLDDVDSMDEDTVLGVGKIEDFSWKGLLDLATCTECGRCQSQCPAWNTEKPLSPKLLIMNLRDHAFGAGDYILADEAKREKLPAGVLAEAARPLVGETEGTPWHPSGGAVIDNDILWSCTSCGACVNQCPVDIEHVDHIIDMRRYQVLVESNFPSELNGLFKGMENKGNPWNMSPTVRMDWAKDLPFDVKVVGDDIETLDEVDWLFWVGCAGAYEDRAKKTTRAVAELLDLAGVSFAVLGNGETCTGDSARRAGNEFVYQGLAQQNVETFNEYKVKKVVSTCAHCFNTLKNEYKDFGIELEVVHHTQLLNRLVREGKLTPVADGAGAAQRTITYHDPCFLGRHNQVYSPPRELLEILPGATVVEMERNSEKSFCCGAGGARMWMEETIGERINVNRTAEAVGTGADQIATGCPFCRVMLADGLLEQQADGKAREEVEVLDVAQMLLASVKGESATRAPKAAPGTATKTVTGEWFGADAAEGAVKVQAPGSAPAATEAPAEEAPAAGGSLFGDAPAGGSMFDVAPSAPAAPAAPAGGSLFDAPAAPAAPPAEAKPAGGSLFDAPAAPAAPPGETKPAGGSLFDTPAPEPAAPAPAAPAAPATPAAESTGGSLFDFAAPEAAPAAPAAPAEPETILEADDEPEAEPEPEPEAPKAEAPKADPPKEGGSLFDF